MKPVQHVIGESNLEYIFNFDENMQVWKINIYFESRILVEDTSFENRAKHNSFGGYIYIYRESITNDQLFC